MDYSAQCQNRARLTVSMARDGGTASFVNGLVHIAAADTPLDDDQARQAEIRCQRHPAWHLPVAADPIALVYRVDGVGELTLRPVTLAQVFSGVITRWNDPAIAADNPEATLPEARIEVFFRAGRTGATEALGDYLNRQAADAWPVGGTPAWRGAGQARGTAREVYEAIRSTPNAIGYVERSQLPAAIVTPTPSPTATPAPGTTATPSAASSATVTPGATVTPTATPTGPTTPQLLRLRGAGEPVALTEESAERAIAGLRPLAEGNDLVLDPASLDAAPDGWPIARVTYQILCSVNPRADLTPLTQDWLAYLLADDTDLADHLALAPELRQRVRTVAESLT